MLSLAMVWLMTAGALPGAQDYLAAHEAQRVAHYGDAIRAYTACAGKDETLAPYARIQAAFCRCASGDAQGGIKECQRLLKELSEGPWVRMAQTYLAAQYALGKAYKDATVLFTKALSLDPKPWSLDRYERMAADAYLNYPETEQRAYAYFANVVATTRLRAARLDAAEQLLKSSDPDNKLLAGWAMTKSGECENAQKLLIALAPDTDLGRILAPKEKTIALESLAPLRQWIATNPDDAWARTCLAHVARTQTAAGNVDTAKAACDLLMSAFPKADEAVEALGWLAARLAKDGKKAQAVQQYVHLAAHYPKSSRADDALFAAAEIQRAQGEIKPFVKTVQRLAEAYPDSPFIPKAWYWAALAQERAGNKREAAKALTNVAQHGVGDFYAHRALVRLQALKQKTPETGKDIKVDGEKSFLKAFRVPTKPFKDVPKNLLDTPRFERLTFFGKHGLEEGEWETLDLADQLKTGADAAAVYQILGEAGLAYTAMNYAERFNWDMTGGKPGPERLRIRYPRAYWPKVLEVSKETGVDPYLILAVARQESTYRPALTSSAGAIGVMQLMPDTAKHLAKTDPDISEEHIADLESPANSLKLGAHYLARMLERSGGNIAYALASYNAGPGNCDKWRAQFGKADLETFIESIPFTETRDYVKIVLANYAAYYSLYPPVETRAAKSK